jgi:hypothetical protein
MICGALLVLGAFARTAWAQEAAKPDQGGGNWLIWIILLAPVMGFALILYSMVRSRKVYSAADRSLQLAEESNELARQQLAMQAETNRLLERLIAERGDG